MDKALTAAADKVSRIITVARGEGPSPDRPARVIAWDGALLNLTRAESEIYDDALVALLKLPGVEAKYSERFVEKALHSFLSSAMADTQFDVGSAVTTFQKAATTYATEQTVVLPLIGMQMTIPSVDLGAVSLTRLEGDALAEVIDTMTTVINGTIETPESKARLIEQNSALIAREFAGGVVSVYRIIAEPGRALERGLDETRRSLDLLRFAIPALYRREQRVGIGLPGEVPRAQQSHLVVSPANFTWGRQAAGAFLPLTLTPESLNHLRAIGVFELSDILKKDMASTSEFERALVNSVHWFSSAQMQSELENAFLNVITCLESLLTPRDGNPIGMAIAESVAILLGENLEQRKSIKRRVRDLYAKRSAVSHGGGKAILDDEFRDLEQLAGEVLARLIPKRTVFGSQKALSSWFEDQRLSGGIHSLPS